MGTVKTQRPNVTVGKPKRIVKASSMRLAYAGANTSDAANGNYYSPELSTDFLELPQSMQERWNYFRHFYRSHPFVGQAIDLHTELPLSKIRIGAPKGKSRELSMSAMRFCERWAKSVKLLHRLMEVVHDYNLIGEVFIFAEDTSPDMPEEVHYQQVNHVEENEKGEPILRVEKTIREDANERAVAWLKKNYKGWTALRILPPEQVEVESFPFTDEKLFSLKPDNRMLDLVDRARSGDKRAVHVLESMPADVINALNNGENITLNTDPDAGSFLYYMARKRSQYEERGHSLLERCIRTLVHQDKLRQANASIASRHMTPVRIVWAEDMDATDTEELRDQVDMALADPDFSIVANFEIRWEEMGGGQGNRLLEVSQEYERADRELYAGLGVTEALLTGESSYSGDRIGLEVVNVRYMLMREILQDFVQEHLFEPMCRRMGFIEEDEDGNEVVLVPTLSFTRLGIRDSQDTFDAFMNLYQKGSLPVEVIYELLNIDPVSATEKLGEDAFTIKDATFNELFRGLYGEVARQLVEGSDVTEMIAKQLGLEYSKPKEEEEGGGRFGG